MKYIFVDPVNKYSSGITKYVQSAASLLKCRGVSVEIISKDANIAIDEFRLLLAEDINNRDEEFIVESPETYASALYFNTNVKSHVRLHFSRVLGNFLEGKPIIPSEEESERKVISRAWLISSPSLAAITFTKFFYDFKCFTIYPNVLQNPSGRDIGKHKEPRVGFIGRWHQLKGIEYIESLVEDFPDLNFVMQSESVLGSVKNSPNVEIISGNSGEKIYEDCQVIIVPSYFETFSMVVGEAISYGCNVVTWDHIGALEFIHGSFVFKAKAFKYDELKLALRHAVEKGKHRHGENVVNNMNEMFLTSLNLILRGELNASKSLANSTIDNSEEILALVYEARAKIMSKRELTSFERKFRKLKKKPVLFFVDMFKKKFKAGYHPAATGSISKPPIKSNTGTQKRRAKLFCNISEKKGVTFHDWGVKAKHYRVSFIFESNLYSNYDYRDLLENCYSHFDFWPLRRENLSRGYVESSMLANYQLAGDWFSKMDLKEHQKLDSIGFVFLFDIYNTGFIEFIRSLNPFVNIILVYTKSASAKFNLSCQYSSLSDCLIIPESWQCSSHPRKCLKYSDTDHLDVWIRKTIQEGLPKEYNYLLPVFNSYDYNPRLKSHNTTDSEVVITLKKDSSSTALTGGEYLKELASNVGSILASEKVYLKYKTICDDIETDPDMIYHFLKYAFLDGVMIDVR